MLLPKMKSSNRLGAAMARTAATMMKATTSPGIVMIQGLERSARKM